MNNSCIKILLIEDTEEFADFIRKLLLDVKDLNLILEHADRLGSGLDMLGKEIFDVILLDLGLPPDSHALDTLDRVYAHSPDVPIVVLTIADEKKLGIKALHKGAQDYLQKDLLDGSSLTRSIRYAIERNQLQIQLKQQVKKLQSSETKFRILAEVSLDGILVVNGVGILRFVNPSGEILLNKKAEELIGEPFGIPLIQGKTTEIDIISENGLVGMGEMRAVKVKWDNENAFLISIRDITAHIEIEQELKQVAEQLAHSNKELEQFAYIASHDMREPLRKITGFGELLKISLEEKLDEDQQENLGYMIDGATRMQLMIDDLLIYSRVSTRAKPFKKVDLNKIIEDLKKIELATILEEKGGVLHIPESLPQVSADPVQMHQLFQNLISNALKFQRENIVPEITVRASDEGYDMVRVEIEDNGIGIDEQYKEQIFTMFKRLHSRQKYDGSGIGLAVCKKIIQRHGGEIGIESKSDEGSIFWFTLQKYKTQSKEAQKPTIITTRIDMDD